MSLVIILNIGLILLYATTKWCPPRGYYNLLQFGRKEEKEVLQDSAGPIIKASAPKLTRQDASPDLAHDYRLIDVPRKATKKMPTSSRAHRGGYDTEDPYTEFTPSESSFGGQQIFPTPAPRDNSSMVTVVDEESKPTNKTK